MLINSTAHWPDDTWPNKKKVFYVAYYSAVFLDYYLTIRPTTSPLPPFTLVEPENIPPAKRSKQGTQVGRLRSGRLVIC